MTASKTSWVVLDLKADPPGGLCQRCGDTYPLKLPMAINEMCRRINTFRVLHEDCKSDEPEA